ncbi:hypothetical protein ABZY09_33915 [Streptomyces sp. NPDC002928]
MASSGEARAGSVLALRLGRPTRAAQPQQDPERQRHITLSGTDAPVNDL